MALRNIPAVAETPKMARRANVAKARLPKSPMPEFEDNGGDGEGEDKIVAAPPKKGGMMGKKPAEVMIPKIQTSIATITLRGTAPLIVHAFGAKARKMILDKQKKVAKVAREAKDPFQDFVESLYILPGAKLPAGKLESGDAWPFKANTFGFPKTAFKQSAIGACSYIMGVTKVHVRGAIHIIGDDIVPIKYSKLVMREDVVRIGPIQNRVADIRFRGEFRDWSVTLQIQFNSRLLTIEQVVNLFEHAGFHVGVGEWRKEKDGDFGTFTTRGGK